MSAMLEITDLHVSYGQVDAVRGVSLALQPGQIISVIGPNGAGKTTLLAAAMGLLPSKGVLRFEGEDLHGLDVEARVERGLCLVPEKRELFGDLSVLDNLQLGAYKLFGTQADSDRRLDKVFSLFPRLRERVDQMASSMSGGEQQMLAVGRALMADPKLLILDEPSLGLAPRVATEILSTLGALNKEGLGILLVEQKAPLALKLAQRVYILSSGSVRAELPTHEIKSHHDLARYYFA